MGGSSSKGGAAKGPKPKACIHSPLPVDVVPYPGPPLAYLLCQVPVQLSSNVSFGFTAGRPMVTSNVDSYYQLLAQYYQQGYRLNTFYCVPGAQQASGFGKVSTNFEAIFSKPADGSPVEGGLPYDLRIEKSMMHIQMMNYGIISFGGPQGTVAQTNDILQKIGQHSALGGRLVCIEMTGQVQSQGMTAAMSGVSEAMGVDLFFNVPRLPSPPTYTYQAVHVPIMVHLVGTFPQSLRADCDWMGNMALYLNQGWRLVEIFLDKGMIRQGAFTTSCQVNAVWFFEKETARLQDPTPLYEGSVINYTHKIKAGFGGASIKSDWTPLIQQMGQMGWELACPLETPAQTMSGFGKIDMQMLLFFQRRILRAPTGFPPPTGSAPPTGDPPPYQPPHYPGGVPPPPQDDGLQVKLPPS